MPFKSKTQIAKFAELVKQGKMKQSTFDEWSRSTGNTSLLPERVKPKKAPKAKETVNVWTVRPKRR